MMTPMRWWPPLLATLATLVACAQNERAACQPTDYRYCSCASGDPGYERCADDGQSYGACDCSGQIPKGAGVLVDAAAADAGAKEAAAPGTFLSPCTDSAQCATKLCFSFNAFGPHCTHPCANDDDCEAPSPGCSNNKVCKLH